MAIHAVIPAAGLSRRMGRPKLTLDLGGRSVIARLLETLNCDAIVSTTIVCRNSDTELRGELATFVDHECLAERTSRFHVETPAIDPPDMRASVEIAIERIRERSCPGDDDSWLLIPADHPMLDRGTLNEVLAAWRHERSEIMIPTYQGRGGHPTFFRWSIAAEVATIPPDQGINWLLKNAQRVARIEVASEGVVCDLDTPEDYARVLAKLSGE